MSEHHHDPVGENIETHPVKLAIAVTVGAVGLIVGIILLAYFAVGTHRPGATEAKANTPQAVAQRIAPLVTIAADPSKAPAAAPVAAVATARNTAAPVVAVAIPAAIPPAAAPAAATVSSGESVYKASCAACHAAGIAGAPKIGDKAAWAPRIAKGKPMLYEHSLKGFNAMPAKGGNTALSDADVKLAVDYQLAQVK
jgi:cytochrome c5